jgi:hypothetical protein
MFIDSLRSGSALRQEGHVDVAKPLVSRQRSNRLMLNRLYFGTDMALLTEGEKHHHSSQL